MFYCIIQKANDFASNRKNTQVCLIEMMCINFDWYEKAYIDEKMLINIVYRLKY